jgi:hypothetical protein
MAYLAIKLLATASVVLLPITRLYIEHNGPLYTKTEERIGGALVASTLLCMMGTIIAIVWAVLP